MEVDEAINNEGKPEFDLNKWVQEYSEYSRKRTESIAIKKSLEISAERRPSQEISIDKSFLFELQQEDPIFSNLLSMEFNILEFREKMGQDKTLPLVSAYLYNVLNMQQFFPKAEFKNFIQEINAGYMQPKNFYHNETHGADVGQAAATFVTTFEGKEVLRLTEMDVSSFVLASIIHDFKHFGVNNIFL